MFPQGFPRKTSQKIFDVKLTSINVTSILTSRHGFPTKVKWFKGFIRTYFRVCTVSFFLSISYKSSYSDLLRYVLRRAAASCCCSCSPAPALAAALLRLSLYSVRYCALRPDPSSRTTAVGSCSTALSGCGRWRYWAQSGRPGSSRKACSSAAQLLLRFHAAGLNEMPTPGAGLVTVFIFISEHAYKVS